MTLNHLPGCCTYKLLGTLVIGYAIAFSGGDAFAQTPSPSCLPGRVCIREIPSLQPHRANPPARRRQKRQAIQRQQQRLNSRQ